MNDELIGDILTSFLASGEATRKHHSNAPKIISLLGTIPVSRLDRAELRTYVKTVLGQKTSVGRPFTPATVAAHFAILRRAIHWRAEELNTTPPSIPFSTRLLPKGWDVKRDRRLSPGELQALLRQARTPNMKYGRAWRMLIRLAIETGARLQELIRAEWREVDAHARVWHVPGAHTKTKTSRSIPLSRRAIRILKVLGLSKELCGPIFPCFANPASASAGFHKLSIAAGLSDFRFHDLRHEAISRMVVKKRRLHVFEIMKIVGHSDSRMLSRYTNLRADELVERME